MGRSALDVVEISSDDEEAEAEAEAETKDGSRPGKLVMLCRASDGCWRSSPMSWRFVVSPRRSRCRCHRSRRRASPAAFVRAGMATAVAATTTTMTTMTAWFWTATLIGRLPSQAGSRREVAARANWRSLQRKDRYINLIACRDFPHSRHLCSQFSFNTTPHVKHCSMCYCFVCDAPAPCRYWGNGLTIDDHCHATDKETKWKTLRQAFKCKSLTASHPEKQQNVVYPTMLSPRQQECDEEYTSEDEEYYGPAAEGTLYVGNLRHHIDDEYLAQLFENVGIVEFSEVSLMNSSSSLFCHQYMIKRLKSPTS
ncbi:hypothetical protein BRADI_2g16231v3 [Brachypodium distachyon]|uniref:RRM domain-containing protein n=1 Tax=Brachypodium distachyon TaxID=15368 RepID=A0A2K2D8S2_BRADI|nr:hypothetical protein BRADI_2g16231v3 [Brachypodium distachyon]